MSTSVLGPTVPIRPLCGAYPSSDTLNLGCCQEEHIQDNIEGKRILQCCLDFFFFFFFFFCFNLKGSFSFLSLRSLSFSFFLPERTRSESFFIKIIYPYFPTICTRKARSNTSDVTNLFSVFFKHSNPCELHFQSRQ